MRHLLLILALVCLAGCAHWHTGSTLPPEQRKVHLAAMDNRTSEHRLTPWLKSAITQELSQVPGVRTVADKQGAGLILTTTIRGLDQNRAARSRIRGKKDRDDSSDAYQTVLYHVTITVDWEAKPTASDAKTRKGTITGEADMPLMPDREIAFATALQSAARDAAAKLAAALTEQ